MVFLKKSIVKKAQSRLFEVKSDVALPPYGVRWQAYVDQMRQAITELKCPEDVLRYAQSSIGFEHRGNIHHEGKFTAIYERELYSEFPPFAQAVDQFADIPNSAPDTTYEHKGRLISNVLFYLARVVLRCVTHIHDMSVVLEIGGGYGAPARLWLRNPVRPIKCFIILDIPESLFFADVFLRDEFGDSNVHYVESQEPLDSKIFEGVKVILCPLSRYRALLELPVDLVINTGSMQEMSEDWVDFYGDLLDRQCCRWFYSLNYFAQPISYLAESVNIWSPRLKPRWVARSLRWNPAFVRMQSDRNFLEAIYEKDGEPVPTEECVLQIIKHLDSRHMTGEVFAEYMELIRRKPMPYAILSVIRRAMRELPFLPKEAAFLVDLLLKIGDMAEVRPFLEELRGYQEILEEKRRMGVEAIY